MKYNKGEWSELYTILYLLANNKLNIVDNELQFLSNNIFHVKSIISETKDKDIEFHLKEDEIIKINSDNSTHTCTIDEIRELKEELFSNILTNTGTFEIKKINDWLNVCNISNFKGKTKAKSDIFLINMDVNQNKQIKLGYSIKSKLGSPATILNASSHTNFRYIVKNLNSEHINIINSINTKTKLKDRISAIKKYNGDIIFDKVTSNTFDKNLKMIDMSLPATLGEILLKSYETEKNLKDLFMESSIYNDEEIALKKLEDFLIAISFGMFPSEAWSGRFQANGGLLIVETNSEIYTIDMLYFPEEVKKFLVTETKLDSPSSSRYDMLNLKEEQGEVFFTLNLQVRYKK